MKCPICVREGTVSKLYVRGTNVTLMTTKLYYDEEGHFHVHDPNWHRTMYTCSNGHNHRRSWITKCLAPCPFGGDEKIEEYPTSDPPTSTQSHT